MASPAVPDIVIGRLPLYLRALTRMAAGGRVVTSSQELGETLGISSAQIRKDLSQFGEFGKQGTGYDVAFLIGQLRRILHVEAAWDVVLVGVGDLGRALAHYGGFINRGFRIVAAFDSDPAKIGTAIGPLVVQDAVKMEEEVRRRGLRVAMLAVPAGEAQLAADRLVRSGILAILCFAPTSVTVPEPVRVQYTDPVLHLQRMTYYLTDDRT